jgi:hypothetical protein
MRTSLRWIPSDRIRELSASDLAVLRMCRVVTLFLVAAIVYFTVIVSGVGARRARPSPEPAAALRLHGGAMSSGESRCAAETYARACEGPVFFGDHGIVVCETCGGCTCCDHATSTTAGRGTAACSIARARSAGSPATPRSTTTVRGITGDGAGTRTPGYRLPRLTVNGAPRRGRSGAVFHALAVPFYRHGVCTTRRHAATRTHRRPDRPRRRSVRARGARQAR